MTPTPAFLRDVLGVRLLIVGGKGGAGKTSCATAAALQCSAVFPDKSTLLVSIDPAHSVLDSLAGLTPPRNLTVLEFDVKACLEAFRVKNEESLRQIAAAGTFLDDYDIDRLLNLTLPGADELMAFLEISSWIEGGAYDCIVVDTAPSGHTLRLLEVPLVLRQWIGMLDALVAKHRYMRRMFNKNAGADRLDRFIAGWSESVERLDVVLHNPAECRFVLVATPDSLAVEESIEFLGKLQSLKVPISDVLVNQLRPRNRACDLCSEMRATARRSLAPLIALAEQRKYRLWGVDLMPDEVRGGERLFAFWSSIRPLEIAGSGTSLRKRARTALETPGATLSPTRLRLALYSGKGGVGKTTLACASALWLAQEAPHKRTLLISTGPTDSLSSMLGMNVAARPVAIRPGLSAVQIDANSEFMRLKESYAEDIRQVLEAINIDVTFDRVVLEKMIDLAPAGLDELIGLTRIVDLLAHDGYDTIVAASASTGHLIRLLELPEIVDQWLKTFFDLLLKYEQVFQMPRFGERLVQLSRDLKHFRALLKDSARAALYAVALPTQMAFEETRDLLRACSRIGVAVPAVFVNMLTPPSECPFCSALRKRERVVVDQFRNLSGCPQVVLVDRQIDMKGLNGLGRLGSRLFEEPVATLVGHG